VRSLAVVAAIGAELGVKPVVDERVGVRAGDDEHRAAVAAVAAARAAARNELLAAERQTAASAAARGDVNVDLVYKQFLLFQRVDADDAAVRAVVLEFHAPGDLREDCVVFAEAGVEAGPEAASALANDDGAAAHEIAVVRFDAKPLGVGIAAVPGAALSFFMSHWCKSATEECP